MQAVDIEAFHRSVAAALAGEYRPTATELAEKMVKSGNWLKRDGTYYVNDSEPQ